jgi:hypothetical protein
MTRVKLSQEVYEALARRRLVHMVEPVLREPAEGLVFVEGPFHTNRATRRAAGQRGYGYGQGSMTIPKGRRS